MAQVNYFDEVLLEEKSKPIVKKAARLHLLDSIRGWASLQVLIFHVCSETFSRRFPELKFNGIFIGEFAVCVFFVLSGEALSYAYFVSNDKDNVRKQAIKRYTRLVIPIFVSCALVFLLLKEHLVFSHDAARLLRNDDWLGQFVNFDANFKDLLVYIFYGVFFNHKGATSYNPFLWSMSIELIGSMILFLVLFITQSARQRHVIYAILALYFLYFNTFFACFIFGMAFAELRAAGFFQAVCTKKTTNWIALLTLSVVIASSFFFLNFMHNGRFFAIASALFLFPIYCSSWLQAIFDNRLSHFLGEMSFPIYLIHFPIIISLQSYLVLLFFRDGAFTASGVFIIIAVTICASLFAAYCFRPVERFAIKASNAVFVFIDRF